MYMYDECDCEVNRCLFLECFIMNKEYTANKLFVLSAFIDRISNTDYIIDTHPMPYK